MIMGASLSRVGSWFDLSGGQSSFIEDFLPWHSIPDTVTDIGKDVQGFGQALNPKPVSIPKVETPTYTPPPQPTYQMPTYEPPVIPQWTYTPAAEPVPAPAPAPAAAPLAAAPVAPTYKPKRTKTILTDLTTTKGDLANNNKPVAGQKTLLGQ
jgi:hypothetical protein